MDNKEIIRQSEEYLLQGKEEEARALLLEYGYCLSNNIEIQKLFLEKFQPAPELRKELNGSLKDLFSDDLQTRQKAAAYINKQSRSEWSTKKRAWLKDPRTIEILIKALHDPDEKVILEITIALGMIAQRYKYLDTRIYTALTQKFKEVDDQIKIKIAQSIACFKFEETWEYVLDVLKCEPVKLANWTVGMAIAKYAKDASVKQKGRLLDPLLEAYKNEKDSDSKASLMKGMREIGNQSILSELLELGEKEKNSVLKKEIEFTVRTIKERAS